MARTKSSPKKEEPLRKRAEKLPAKKGKRIPKKPPEDLQKLIHDLQGHKAELEMQNEELRRAQLELEESRNKYAELYDFAPTGFFTLDRKGRIVAVNLTGAWQLGVERRSLINQLFYRFVLPECRNLFLSFHQRLFATGTKQSCELTLMKKGGGTFYGSMVGVVVQDLGRRVTECQCAITDITERKKIECALQGSQQSLKKTFASLREAVFILDAETTRIIDCNPAASKVFGYAREEMLGKTTAFLHVNETKLAEFRRHLNDSLEKRDSLDFLEFQMKRKDGEVFVTEHSVAPLKDESGKLIGWVSVVRDISQRKKMEEEIRKSRDDLEIRVQKRTAELAKINEELKIEIAERRRAEKAVQDSEMQLRHLSNQLMAAQENERKRVASELHDGLQQYLTGIKLKVEAFLQEVRNSGKMTETKPLEDVIPIIQESVREIRRIHTNLRPSILDDLGILPTISWFCREYEATHRGIQVEKRIHVQESEVPEPLKMAIYRIVQEGMTNITKHSGASFARLSLGKAEGRIELSIQDNGRGFDLQGTLFGEKGRSGMGLGSMQERAEHSGGSFFIESEEGKGTVLRVTWNV